MASAVRTASITFPNKDIEMLQRIILGMGWQLHIDESSDDIIGVSERQKAEEVAHRIAYNIDEFEELKNHDFYLRETPQCVTFADVESEVAYLDAADEDGYVCEEEVEHLRSLWKIFD